MTRAFAAMAVAMSAMFAATPAAAQNSQAVLQQQGAGPLARDVTFPASKTLIYRVVWPVHVAAERPDSVVPGFRSAANFFFVSDSNGVPRANVHQAIVVWGAATYSLLGNEAYRRERGADNASIPLLQALADAGVPIIVCGEALIHRKLDRADLLPFVKIAPNAPMALATLQAQGYGVMPD